MKGCNGYLLFRWLNKGVVLQDQVYPQRTRRLPFPLPHKRYFYFFRGVKMSLIQYQAYIYICMYLYNDRKQPANWTV